MSNTLFIPRHQFALTRRVAQALHAFHSKRHGQNFRATLTGIRAEFAVVQFVNYGLGLLNRVDFRTEYNERGGDGGFDFEMCGLKCDVKYSKNLKIPKSRIASSTADLIIMCTKMRHTEDGVSLTLLGWAPRSRILNALDISEQLNPSHFRTFTLIKSSTPQLFSSEQISYPKKPDFVGVSTIISDVIQYMEHKANV